MACLRAMWVREPDRMSANLDFGNRDQNWEFKGTCDLHWERRLSG